MHTLTFKNLKRGKKRMPTFLTKKDIHEWIKTGKKTIELRKGKAQNGDSITFLNGRNQTVKARILRKQEGALKEVLTEAAFKKIVPTARNLEEAFAFIKRIYPSTEGTFATYEFELVE